MSTVRVGDRLLDGSFPKNTRAYVEAFAAALYRAAATGECVTVTGESLDGRMMEYTIRPEDGVRAIDLHLDKLLPEYIRRRRELGLPVDARDEQLLMLVHRKLPRHFSAVELADGTLAGHWRDGAYRHAGPGNTVLRSELPANTPLGAEQSHPGGLRQGWLSLPARGYLTALNELCRGVLRRRAALRVVDGGASGETDKS